MPKFTRAKGRWYPIHDSSRLSLDESLQGIYFFGYRNFLYTQGTAQVALTLVLTTCAHSGTNTAGRPGTEEAVKDAADAYI